MSVVEVPIGSGVTVRDVLRRAADLIEEYGWCQEHYGSKEEGQFCMLGAAVCAAEDLGHGGFFAEREQLAYDVLKEACGDDPALWNDEPTRTKAEVVARLRAAAEAAATA